jgi:hypothetical protein
MAGRVPGGVTALVMLAPPGAELACRAKNYVFGWGRGMEERGVISFYATRGLLAAQSCADWLAAASALAETDAHSGKLPKTHRPLLQTIGDTALPLIGSPA